jgi:hypothetical protein
MEQDDTGKSWLEHIMNSAADPPPAEPSRSARIRALNDRLRIHGHGGMIVVSEGIASLGISEISEIFAAIGGFDDFNPDNDPYGEHDSAIVTVCGIRVLWKIDTTDRSRRFLSPNPADPSVTVRVLTVMRDDEG